MLSGGLCGLTSTAMKLALDIFVFSPACWSEYMFYVMMAALLLTSFLNFLNLTTTLMLYSQLYTMPSYESSIIFGNLMAGGFIMNEFVNYTALQLFFLFLGSAIAVAGILYKVRYIDEGEEE